MANQPQAPTVGAHLLRSIALALAGVGLVTLAYRQPFTYRVDVGADDEPYVEGFEFRERRDPVDWRWSAGRSRLVFHNAGQLVQGPRLRLRLTSLQPASASAIPVSITLGEYVVATFDAPRALAVKEFGVDTRRLGTGDWTLSIASQGFERRTGRVRGVMVDWVELVSDPAPRLPPLRTTALFVLCSVSLYVLMITRGFRRTAGYACLACELLGWGALSSAREATVELLVFVAGILAAVGLLSLAVASGLPARLSALAATRAPTLFLFGGAFLFGGQIVLAAGGSRAAGLGLLALGVVAVVTTPRGGSDQGAPTARVEWIALVSLTALALFLRVYRLGEVPFAIFRDEARHGTLALRLLDTESLPPLFFGPPINQPAPYFLALAALFQLLGPGLVSLRLVSALAGAASVPLAWRLVRGTAGPRIALVAAFALAVSSWHISISRLAINYVVPTLFTLPAYLFLLKGLRSGRPRDFVLSGMLAGTAQYASHTAKSALFVIGAMLVDELAVQWRARRWPALRRVLRGAAAAAGFGLLIVAPVLQAIWRAPEDYTARMRQVSIWQGANAEGEYRLTRLARNLGATLGAFNVQGDPNGRHHLPGKPLLDPISAGCFAVGATVVAGRLRESRYRFFLYWFVGAALPGLLTVDAPSATRMVEVAAAACAITAIGAVALLDRVRAHLAMKALSLAALPVLAASALALNARVYFVEMYRSPAVWGKFAPVGTQLGQRLKALEAAGGITEHAVLYAPEAFVRHPDELHVLRFFVPRLEVRSFQADGTAARAGDLIVIPNYRDLWRHVATVIHRYASRAEEARADSIGWRQWLESTPRSTAEEGAAFPGTADPTYWLAVVEQPPEG